jgi:hypothetical protein
MIEDGASGISVINEQGVAGGTEGGTFDFAIAAVYVGDA